MRKHLGAILVGLGVFVLILGALSRFYAYPKLAVVPLDKYSALKSTANPDPTDPPMTAEASDATILSLADGGKVITTHLTSVRNTIGQVEDSQKLDDATGKDLVIYETFNFTKDGKDASSGGVYDRVIFDRTTGAAYTCPDNLKDLCDEKTGDANIDPDQTDSDGTQEDISYIYPGEGSFKGFQGQYFKMPFNTQKKTYQWWDGTLDKATDAKYVSTETLDGLTCYKFVQVIPATKVGTQQLPAELAGIDQPGNITVDSMYSNIRTLWIEPETGVLIKGQEQQDNYFAYQGKGIVPTTRAVVTYNDATVQSNVDLFKPLSTQLKVIRLWLPLVGLALGLILIVVGGVDILRRRRAPAIRRRTSPSPPALSPIATP